MDVSVKPLLGIDGTKLTPETQVCIWLQHDSKSLLHLQQVGNVGHTGLHVDKGGYQVMVFLFLDKNICYGYSLEGPRQGASHEYPQHMFSLGNKKNTDFFWLKKVPCQELWPVMLVFLQFIGVNKSEFQVNVFFISPRKHMLLVLIRSTSPRCF